MPSKPVPALPPADVLTGAEEFHLVQGGNSRHELLSGLATWVLAQAAADNDSGALTQAAADARYLQQANIAATASGPSGTTYTGGSPAKQYWRLSVTDVQGGGGNCSIVELQFRETAGTPETPSGGNASSSSNYDASSLPANAFDGVLTSMWSSNVNPSWIEYNYGAGTAKAINEIAITIRNDSFGTDQGPKDFAVQWSPDGAAWTTEWSVAGAAWGAAGEVQIFTNPNATEPSNATEHYPTTIAALNDVNAAGKADGQVLTYVAADGKWEPRSLPADLDALSALTDVLTAGEADGYVLTYVAADGKWEAKALPPDSDGAGGSSTLAGLSDVNTTGEADGYVLTYVAADGKWEAKAAAAGSGSDWTALTFGSAAATKWGDANTFASDQSITLAEGDKLEVSIIIDRVAANELGLGISPDGAQCYISRVDTTDSNVNYYYITSGGVATKLGALITNGDFSSSTGWTLGSGATISGGKLNCSNCTNIAEQAIAIAAGSVYNFSFDYTMTAGSALRITNGAFGSTAVYTSPALGASGTLSGSFTAQGTNFNLEAVAANFSGTIDNVAVGPQNPVKYNYNGGIEIRFIVYVGAAGSKNRISTIINSTDTLYSLDGNVNLVAATNKIYLTAPGGDLTKIKAVRYRKNA